MPFKKVITQSICGLRTCCVALAAFQLSLGGAIAAPLQAQQEGASSQGAQTRSPIKHVIVIIGENRTFDHVFATYKPRPGESVDNLLSKRIINEDGTPGPNYSLAVQYSAVDTHRDKYQVSPMEKSLYSTLPAPLVGGPTTAPFSSVSAAEAAENGLDPDYYKFLTTGGTGQKSGTPDLRIPNVDNLPPGPFQLTSSTLPYDSYTASPVHRFYQMWQQLDCNIDYATVWNPSGCQANLFPWVETTIGAGSNGKPQVPGFNLQSTKEGSTSMGFFNVLNGDAPYLKQLADSYAMSDNYHQGIMGGTGANHIVIGTADAIWFSDSNGNPAMPPRNKLVAAGTPNAGVVNEIENPNAAPGTNNWYTEDGYGAGSYGSASYGGGSYSNCSDSDAPGVGSVLNYLGSLPHLIDPRCAPGHFYLLNNYNPGYFGNGANAYADASSKNTVFTIPPSNVRNIGDALLEKNISFKYYGDQFNLYVNDPYYLNPKNAYCNICNFFQYSTAIMTDPAVRTAHLQDTVDLYQDLKNGTLPAVSFVKPSGLVDGHPSSSKLDLFEGFVKKIVDGVKSNPSLWKDTAIFVTVDEGGGYYDSGYVQPLDFFGDGTRIPLIVVSPYTKAGHISHDYADHALILKFIERNWYLSPLTNRSRDNFPNPQYDSSTRKYVPVNSPAIGDLFDLFDINAR
ncbi:MAG: phosphoesterase [Acidobacteriota bacterium]|nr:phosphoesterase [Acidobacteriota bacterium]